MSPGSAASSTTSRCKTAAGWFSLVVGEDHHSAFMSTKTIARRLSFD
jgi:hypothetical protein